MSLPRLLAAWLALAVLMSANGVARELLLRPRVGSPGTDVLSAVIGTALILLVTAAAFRPFPAATTAELLAASALLVGLTVAFEFGIGRWVDHKSWATLVDDYALWKGHLWPLVLLVVALTPFLWGRWVPLVPGDALPIAR